LSQTYHNWELLITDDCSTDNTVDIIKEYALNNERIKLFQLERNSGAGVARNRSINEAKGRYIAFCDSDDLWMPNKVED
jgi:glycosyltransferase involved in cell wall biosynthesis